MTNNEWIDKYSRQTIGYRELDKFQKGEAGLQYYPVPEEEIKTWEKEKQKKEFEQYERLQKQKLESQKTLLELREESERENGHNKVPIEIPIEYDKLNLTKICKDCDKHTVFCECNKTNKPSHCDLKKKTRKSKKK